MRPVSCFLVGEPRETGEMLPRWWPVARLPRALMWPDNAHWLDRVLAGAKISGYFLYSDLGTIERHELRTL